MSEFRYPQPANEDAFEEFCLVLMRDTWNLPSLERLGHRGERQHGVDLLDLGVAAKLRAVQCKHHAPHKTLPPAELNGEVDKAKTLPGDPIAEFWLLTTARKSAATQLRVRELNRLHDSQGLFKVAVVFWDDIERLIDASPAAQRHLEIRAPEAVIKSVRNAVSEVVAPIASGMAHSDLDEVASFLEKGELVEARLVLRRSRSRYWGDFTEGQKSRWFTLEADVALREGRNEDAAKSLLAAYDHARDDERATVNAATAYHLLGDDKAVSIATLARQRFPSSRTAWAISIEVAPSAKEALEMARAVPSYLRETPEVALAVAARPELRQEFPEYLDLAVSLAPENVRGWFNLGIACVARETQKLDPDAWGAEELNEAQLLRAVSVFDKLIELCKAQGRPALQSDALVQRARTYAVLGKSAQAHQDLERAIALEPNSRPAKFLRATIYAEDQLFEPAIVILRELVQRGEMDESAFLLAIVLWNRNGPGDREESTRLMIARSEQGGLDGTRAHFMAIDGMLAARALDAADTFLAQSVGRVSDVDLNLLTGRVHVAKANQAEAVLVSRRALGGLAPNARRVQVGRVGRLLLDVGLFDEAFPLLERLAADPRDIDAAREFIRCAWRLDRHQEVLKVAARMRAIGIYDQQIIALEVPLLERYDPATAILVLQALLARGLDDQHCRVRLIEVARRLERHDVVQEETRLLPSVGTVADAETGASIVRILLAAKKNSDARDYAYDLLRRFVSSADAHRAVIQSVLFQERGSGEDVLVMPQRVDAGVAVRVRERAEEADKWLVLENSSVIVDDLLDELRPANPLWHRLLGAAVGDEVELAEPGVFSRKARIVELLPKGVYRFRDSLANWQYRFSEHRELARVSIREDEKGEVDFSPLLQVVAEQHQRRAKLDELFRANPVPICKYGEVIGSDSFEATLSVISAAELPVRCCLGSLPERASAMAALDSATELVLDATALATLYSLDMVAVLAQSGKSILVPHSVMSQVRRYAHNAEGLGRVSGSLGMTPKGPHLQVYSQQEKEQFANQARAFKAVLEQVIIECPTTAAAELSSRDSLRKLLDEATIDAVAVASDPRRVLWVDDMSVSQLAKEAIGVRSVWTQGVLLWLRERGMIDASQYVQCSARLLGWRFTYTSLSPAIVVESARLADWDPGVSPLREGLELLASAGANVTDAIQLAAALIREAFIEPMPLEKRRRVLFAVCDYLSGRPDKRAALDRLRWAVPQVFGINVVGCAQAIDAFKVWDAGPLIVP